MNVAGVYPKVREIIADVLVIDEEEVSLEQPFNYGFRRRIY